MNGLSIRSDKYKREREARCLTLPSDVSQIRHVRRDNVYIGSATAREIVSLMFAVKCELWVYIMAGSYLKNDTLTI